MLAVEGSVLARILACPELEEMFFKMSLSAKSVICCRVSPKQKADVVHMYRKRGPWVTLSIGDGANDVSMILEANIGVGIRGKEGTQAVRSADYSISQFRFLQNLLFVHGRNGYIRVAKMICFYFYKNIVVVFSQINFAFFNGFSGQIFFPEWLPQLYNAVFTSWQCLFAFMLEQDVKPEMALACPNVYSVGQEGRLFTFGEFWKQIVLAVWHGCTCYYLTLYGGQGANEEGGRTYETWYSSTAVFALIIHVVTYKLFVDTHYWSIILM